MTKSRCLYPVRVRTEAVWDDVWPGELPCGKPATHTLKLGFYLDGYNRPGLVRHKTHLYQMGLCDKHVGFMPSLAIYGPKAAQIVGGAA